MRILTAVLWMTTVLLGLKNCASSPDDIVDRSSMNLSSVPTDLPQTAQSVDLSCNHIHQLHERDFQKTTQLMSLNVSWNGLENIHPKTFLNTPLLKELDLSYNNLQNLSGQDFLFHTGNLVILNLAWNQFLNMTLGNEFSRLLKLEELIIGAKTIGVDDFKSVAEIKLQTLTLYLEEELYYETGSLENVHAQKLQIIFNGNQTMLRNFVADILSLFVEVEMNNLTTGYTNLTAQFSQQAEIRTSNLSLNNMVIDWKDLTECINAVLSTSIVHLSTSDASINQPPYLETAVKEKSNMESFTIRRGEVKSFFFSQEAMFYFFINMPVKRFAMLESSIIYMTCPKKPSPITELDFSYCALSDSIFTSVKNNQRVECETLVNLTKLILVNNNLKNLQSLSKRTQYMASLRDLDLSLNSLVYDGFSECLWPQNVIIMNMSAGGLTDSVFNCLPKGVETLDLQNNQISVVPQSILKLKNLSSLNLNFNRLRDLPVCDAFPVLTKLLLKSNSIHAPSVDRLKTCPNLKILDVSHNPFTCTCTLRKFITFAKQAETKSQLDIELLSWPLSYYCIYPETVRDQILDVFWIPAVSCSVSLLAATILVPALVLIITVFFLCHRLDVPWYISMIWQWTRAKHRARMQQLRSEDLVGIEFHAFVSYSQHDEDWVKNSLLPNLQGSAGGLRICYHEINFIPGRSIVENIMSCVERSRRSVFVLSSHFVKSEWCHYELYFASHHRLSLGVDSIVLVLLEPLPQYLIPAKYYQLKSMMSRHTYLEWPQDKSKQKLFWANLRAALQTVLPDAPSNDLND